MECILSTRQLSNDSNEESILVSKYCYTHHQKTIVCDAEFEDDKSLRRVVAFIGGLDIADGRYDTPEFHLFKTIKTIHLGDFHQNNFPGITEETGPRQPWVCLKVETYVFMLINVHYSMITCLKLQNFIDLM